MKPGAWNHRENFRERWRVVLSEGRADAVITQTVAGCMDDLDTGSWTLLEEYGVRKANRAVLFETRSGRVGGCIDEPRAEASGGVIR